MMKDMGAPESRGRAEVPILKTPPLAVMLRGRRARKHQRFLRRKQTRGRPRKRRRAGDKEGHLSSMSNGDQELRDFRAPDGVADTNTTDANALPEPFAHTGPVRWPGSSLDDLGDPDGTARRPLKLVHIEGAPGVTKAERRLWKRGWSLHLHSHCLRVTGF